MRVTYLLTTPRKSDPSREAVAQDLTTLAARVQARTLHISPWEGVKGVIRPLIPERLFGMWLLPRLRTLNEQTDVFHIFHEHPRFFTLFNFLRKPVVYSLVSGLRPNVRPNKVQLFSRLAQVTVSNARDLKLLNAWGIQNARVLQQSINLEKFAPLPPPAVSSDKPFRLFMASAPWTLYSFAHKGIDSLLKTMQELSQLHITFLWRDFFYDEMMTRVRATA
ncbi:MAG: hypothetical protein HC853_18695, partial [Anaerolineae bacterium]|nr:hypothetical protein [Anaerolineae bacterium]